MWHSTTSLEEAQQTDCVTLMMSNFVVCALHNYSPLVWTGLLLALTNVT